VRAPTACPRPTVQGGGAIRLHQVASIKPRTPALCGRPGASGGRGAFCYACVGIGAGDQRWRVAHDAQPREGGRMVAMLTRAGVNSAPLPAHRGRTRRVQVRRVYQGRPLDAAGAHGSGGQDRAGTSKTWGARGADSRGQPTR